MSRLLDLAIAAALLVSVLAEVLTMALCIAALRRPAGGGFARL